MSSQEIVVFCFVFHMLRIAYDLLLDGCESVAKSIVERKFNIKFIARFIAYVISILLIVLLLTFYYDLDFSMIFS